MKLVRSIRIARRALRTNRLRAVFALSGVAVGVAASIVTTAIGEGAKKAVLRRIEAMGTNLLVVTAAPVKKQADRKIRGGSVTTLKLADYTAIQQHVPWLDRAAPAQEKVIKVKYGDGAMVTKVLGTMPEYFAVRNFKLDRGRLFTEEDNRISSRVAVLGSRVRETLGLVEDPIGEVVRIGDIPFEVVGALSAKGISAEGADDDNQIVIPLRTALRRVFNYDYLNSVLVSVKDPRRMDQSETEIRELLRERHRLDRAGKPDDFAILNQIKLLAAESETAASFRLLIAGVATVSLLLGGTGILALMLLSVRERAGEIGLRLAVGARPRDVLIQFLAEALALALTGGAVGVALGAFSAWAVGIGTGWQTDVSPAAIALSVMTSVATGIGFGVYPAWKASLLDPVEALSAAG